MQDGMQDGMLHIYFDVLGSHRIDSARTISAITLSIGLLTIPTVSVPFPLPLLHTDLAPTFSSASLVSCFGSSGAFDPSCCNLC